MANPDIKLLIGALGGENPSGESADKIRKELQKAFEVSPLKIKVGLDKASAADIAKQIKDQLKNINIDLSGSTGSGSKGGSGKRSGSSDEVVARKIQDGLERTIANRKKEERSQELAQAKAINKALDEQYRLQQRAVTEEVKKAEAAQRAAQAEEKKAHNAQQTATIVKSTASLNAQNFEKYLQGVSAKGHLDFTTQINQVRELYRVAKEDGLRESLQKADSAARELRSNFKELGLEGGNVFTFIQNKIKSFMVYLVSSKLTNALIKGVRDGVTAVNDLNAEMTQLRIVTGASQAQMDKFLDSATAKAKNVGSSVTDMLNSTTVYARLGYSMDESADLAEYTAMLQNVGDIDVESAQNAITAIVKAYDVGANQVETTMDKMVTVGNNFPISVSQLAEGMNNAGSALSAAGNSFDQSLALLAAANTTVQNISKSSTGLRTIAARIRNTKTELDDLGEAMTDAEYDNLVQSLTKANVSLTGTNGELRSTYDILQDIAKVWGNMTKNDQAALAETLAGTRQQNIFYSLINQFNEASSAMEAMTNSSGAMASANSVYMESVGAKADRMKASFQELASTLLDSDILGWLYDFGNAALNAVSAFDAWPAKIALVAAGLPTLIGLFRELKHMPLIESIGGSFKDLARPKTTGRNWNWANHLEEAA